MARYLTIECVAFRYVTQVFRNLHLLTYPTPLIYFFETSLANIFLATFSDACLYLYLSVRGKSAYGSDKMSKLQ